MKRLLYRRETVIFALALAARLAVFAFLWWWFRITGHMHDISFQFPTLIGDSADYYHLTENLWLNGIFSSSTSFPLIPESFRLPGYPFFLYLFKVFPHSYVIAIVVQMIAAAGTTVITYKIGKRFLSEKAAYIGALLLSFEPTSVFTSTVVMSDTIFVFALMLGIYLLLLKPKNFKLALLAQLAAGLLFGYAVLVRVIAQYLALFLIGAYVLIYRKELKPYSHTALKLSVFVITMILVITPWALREHRQFNTYTLSSTPYINFTQYNLVYFYAYQHHISNAEAQHIYADPIPYGTDSYWFRSLINEPIFKKEMSDGLRGNIIPYAEFHLFKTLPFFMNDSLRDINRVVGIFPPPKALTNFTDLLLHKNIGGIVSYLKTPQPDLWMLLVGTTVWVCISLLGIGGALYAVIKLRKNIWFILFALGVIFYFGILSSPVIQPRYRMPAAPFMLLLAADAGLGLYTFLKKRLSKTNRQSGI